MGYKIVKKIGDKVLNTWGPYDTLEEVCEIAGLGTSGFNNLSKSGEYIQHFDRGGPRYEYKLHRA